MNSIPDDISKIDPNQVYDIELSDIWSDDSFNCRGFIPPEDVFDLARDIRDKGLIQPILVQPWDQQPGKRFRIIAGYSRYKAHMVNAKADNGRTHTIKCLVKIGLTDVEAAVINLSENLRRRDLNILQEAQTLKKFYHANWSEGEIARRTGLSRQWVSLRLKLLDLPEKLQTQAAAGMINVSQIGTLHALPTEDRQYEYFKKIKDAKRAKYEKKIGIVQQVVKVDKKEERNKKAILAMQDVLINTFGVDPATVMGIKALGWAAGLISDSEMYQSIADRAKELGIFYEIPDNVVTQEKYDSLKAVES